MTVTAIRRMGRAQALEQIRLDPGLAEASLASLAKRWGVSRSTARSWMKDRPPPAMAILSPEPSAKAQILPAPARLPPYPPPQAGEGREGCRVKPGRGAGQGATPLALS